jgi:DNA-binding Lrp family transcriptional regulator
MDKLDYLILSELLDDGARSFVDISKHVGTNPCTVKRRYDKMIKEGIIFKCTVTIDLSKLGYQGKAFLFITLGPRGNRSKIIAHLKGVKNVIAVTELIGPYNILAIAPISDLRSIQALLNETRKAPGIETIKIAFINNVDLPISPNFGAILSQKSRELATG